MKNAEPWIRECINSATRQGFTDWEWIWVDDHSTDATLELLTIHSQKDRRIRIFTNPGEGIIPALQTALEKSSGELITRMDADDIMPPDRLQLMTAAAQASPSKTIVTGQVKYFSDTILSAG
ncbi:MAG: glycosyltransferase family A protein, partial [Owenweeksia sp.]